MHHFTMNDVDEASTAQELAVEAPALGEAREGPPVATPTRRVIAEALVREAMKSRARAVRYVTWKGFRDIALDAVQEALLLLARRAADPAFVPPVTMRAWLFRWSVCSAHVLRREGRRLDVVSFDEAVEAFAHACNQAADDDTSSPDARLAAEADEGEVEAWRAQVTEAREAFLSQDRAALDAEVTREDEGTVADPAHRKRLERARRRTIPLLAERGIRSARPPVALR